MRAWWLLLTAAQALQAPASHLLERCAAEAVGGCCGGLAKALAVYPLDRCATRLEVGTRHEGIGAAAERGQFARLRELYRGFGMVALFAAPYALAFHAPFVFAERVFAGALGLDAAVSAALAGFVGATLAAPVGVPAECAKRRVQVGARPRDALSGGASLFDGFAATLARNVPYNGASFGAFAWLRSSLGWSTTAAGVGAGVLTAVATHPFDVVDARQQTARLRPGDPAPPRLLSRATLRGLSGATLLRSLGPRALALAPSTLLFFSVFEPVRDGVLLRLRT